MKNIFLAPLFILMLVSHSSAQESITLFQAMEAALKNNFFINISRNDSSIADNNNSAGNAGFFPSLDAVAGVSTAINNTEQRYSNGNVVNQDGAVTDNFNAAIRLNWTLFDGMRMFATKSRLTAESEAATFRLKAEIERVITDMITAYFDVVRLQQSISVLQETIRINDERVEIANARFEIGAASKLDYLQARVDRDARISELLRTRYSLDNAISQVNLLMGSSEAKTFTASDSITFTYEPVMDDLLKSVPQRNSEILIGTKQVQINDNLIREYQSTRYPWLNANVNYSFNRTENEVGFSLLNQNQGLNAGLTLTWNLFNGFNTGREVKNAKLMSASTKLMLSETQARINQRLAVAFRKYQSDKEVLKLEENSLAFAKENSDVALEAYRLGSISGIQLREAQNSYELALNRLIEARYQAKLSETELMKLNGDLVK